MSNIKYIIRSIGYVWKTSKISLLQLVFIRIIQGIIPLLLVFILKEVVNEVSDVLLNESDSFKPLFMWLLIQFVTLSLGSFLEKYSITVTKKLEFNIEYYIKEEVSRKALDMEYMYFENHNFFDHFQRIQINVANRFLKPIFSIMELVRNLITVFSLIVYLISISLFMGAIAFLTMIPVYFIYKKLGMEKFHLLKYQTPASREHQYLTSIITNKDSNKEVRLLGLQDHLLGNWSKVFRKNQFEMLKLISKQQRSKFYIDLLSGAINLFALLYTAFLLIEKNLKVGDFVSISDALLRTQNTMNQIAITFAGLSEGSLFLKDYFEFLDKYKGKKIKGTKSFPIISKQGIEFKNVTFNYPLSNKLILDKVCFNIKPNETIAIVGENGSGKTTLIKCLLGLYNFKGDISINGISINEINREDLYKNISVVFQDFTKFNLSLKENIVYGDIKNYNNETKLMEIIKRLDLIKLTNSLRDGIDTRLGRMFKGSEQLSGGQWQRVALSRALFREPQILIMDEPTSALDPKTEASLFKQFNKITKNKTTIFISHRMYSCKFADRILVLKNGKIYESGTHEELMYKKGEYYNLYLAQTKMYGLTNS
ncbi:MAG: ABC transporter ATP-binding protein [Bacillaceae bacterium]|nr:ABC transporter ATP-binding protein [Bacillaceae bacterium]